MKFSLSPVRVRAMIGMFGALLLLLGNFLPTFSPADYQHGIYPLPFGNLQALAFIAGVLIVPALIVFAISAWCWFKKVSGWFLLPCLLLIGVALGLHLWVTLVFQAFQCFDMCPPGGPSNPGSGFWLPLVGYALSLAGIYRAWAARNSEALLASNEKRSQEHKKAQEA